jgi:hypothetical protein
MLALFEAQVAAWRRNGAPADGGDAGSEACRLQAHMALVATLAAASPRSAEQLLAGDGDGNGGCRGGESLAGKQIHGGCGSSGVEALRALEALAALHAGCAFHDATRDAVARVFCAWGRTPAFGVALAHGASAGERARVAMLRVLHSVLRR